MPLARCRYYNDDGSPRNGGCLQGTSCAFIHPSDTRWNKTPPSRNDRSREPSGGRGRGRGRGSASRPFGADRSGSNSIPRRGGTDANAGADNGWGTRTESNAWKGAWGDVNTKDDASTSEGWGWGGANDSKKGTEDTGKGKDTESSWSGGWGETSSVPSWGGGWGTEASGGDTWGGGWGAKASGDNTWGGGDGGGWGADSVVNSTLPTSDTSTTLNDTVWGETASSPTTKVVGEWKMPEWKKSEEPSSEPSKADDSTVFIGVRRPNDTDISDRAAKKPRTESLTIPPTEIASGVDIDSPNTTVVQGSAIDAKPLVPIPNPGPRIKVKRQSTPILSAPSSRAPSPERDVAPANGPPRTEKQVSYREAKILWNQYVRLINRAIILKQSSSEERKRYNDYKSAQGSSIYVKTGANGVELLEERARRLKELTTRKEREYRASLNELCTFEDGFDFPMKALTARSMNIKTIKTEIKGMKNYVQDVKAYVEAMASNVDYMESKARLSLEHKPSVVPLIAAAVPEKPIESTATKPIKDEQLEKRLASLEEKAADFSLQFEEIASGLNAQDFVQEKMEEMFSALNTSLDEEKEGDMLKRIAQISEKGDSLGKDIENLGDSVAEIYTSVSQARVEAEQECERVRVSLIEAQEMLAKREVENRESLERLVQLEETSKLLRAEIESIQKQKSSKPQSSAISPELMDELAAVLLAKIKEKVLPECQHGINIISSSVTAVIEENTKKQVQAFAAALIPVYKISGELHAKIEGKAQRGQRSRPESPHIIDTPKAGIKAQTSHS